MSTWAGKTSGISTGSTRRSPTAARSRSFRRSLAALSAVAALAVAAAGCGGGSSVADDAVAQAAEVTAHQGTAQIRITGTMHAAGQSVPMTGGGVLSTDPKKRLGRLTLGFELNGQRLTIQELFVNGAMFMGGGPFDGKLPHGKQWVKIDLFKLLKDQGLDLSKLDDGAGNATQGLAYLRDAGDVKKVGTETVDGVATTHYHASVDMDKALDRLGATQLKRFYDRQVGAGRKTPTDVWIDKDKRIRRYRLSMPAQNGFQMDMTMDFVRFGVVLSLQPPASDQVFDATELARRELRKQAG